MRRLACLITSLAMLLVSCSSGSTPAGAEGGAPASAPSQASPMPGRGEIQGTVLDASSGAPIVAANVSTDPPSSSVTTSADGSYAIADVEPGSYTIVASKGGYVSTTIDISVTADKTTTADLPLLSHTAVTSPPPESTPTVNAPPTSATEPIEISALCSVYGQSPVHVEQGRPIIFTWQWTAAKSELIQDHLDAAIYRILLDGSLIFSTRRSDIEFVSVKNGYAITWYTNPMILEAGKHVTERNLSWTRQVSDGWNTYGPGGKYETLHDTCTIIVQ